MTYRTRSKAANTELSEPESKPTRDAVKTKQPAVRVKKATRSKAQPLAPSEPGVEVIASKAIKDEREPDVKPTSAVTNKRQHTGRTTRSARDKVDKLEGMDSVQRTTRSTRRKNKEPDVQMTVEGQTKKEQTTEPAVIRSTRSTARRPYTATTPIPTVEKPASGRETRSRFKKTSAPQALSPTPVAAVRRSSRLRTKK